VYRSAAGEPLAGRSGFSATGQVEIEDPDQVPGRVSEAFVPGTRLAFAALTPGDGTLSVDLADGSSFTIPVEVVRAADSIDIVTMVLRDGQLAASDQVRLDEPVGADVVGTTTDGRFVLGVGATWSTSEPIDNWLDSNRGSELVFSVPRAGPLQITAQHAHLTVSRQITADAAAAGRRAQ
jgi:hypothetical protein